MTGLVAELAAGLFAGLAVTGAILLVAKLIEWLAR